MATAPSAATSGVLFHEERGSIAMPTNAASNQFVVQLQKKAKPAAGAMRPAASPDVRTAITSATSSTTTTPGDHSVA